METFVGMVGSHHLRVAAEEARHVLGDAGVAGEHVLRHARLAIATAIAWITCSHHHHAHAHGSERVNDTCFSSSGLSVMGGERLRHA